MSTIIHTYPVKVSFIKKDNELLLKHFDIKQFLFRVQWKPLTFLKFINQFIFLCVNIKRSAAVVTQFAGYHALLPALFGKLFGKPSILILGGTDCVAFPSIKYGNFRKTIQGLITKWSILLSSRLVPVHKSLVFNNYTYTDADYPHQGYLYFVPSAVNIPWTEVFNGYNSNDFKCITSKTSNTFLTVTQSVRDSSYYRKGIDLILDIALEFPLFTFTIVGSDNAELAKKASKNVNLIPPVPYGELVRIYSAHEFYLQLSMNEGFPNALCEAMLCECIPIVSDVAAMPFIVADTGFILYKKDVDELKKIITEAVRKKNAMLSRRARYRISVLFTEEKRELELANIILELIAKSGH
jgi:glycosyltransferase involved in cell wall biosynthesis